MILFLFFLSFSIRIQSEYESLSPESQAVIRRFGSLRNFLSCEESIVIVDDYICISSNTENVLQLATSATQ